MYGPAAGTSIVEAAPADLTWANVAAAVLIGIGGSRWLSAEVDKNVFKQTAVEAANSDKNPDLAATIARKPRARPSRPPSRHPDLAFGAREPDRTLI
jgi:hypothetical protein